MCTPRGRGQRSQGDERGWQLARSVRGVGDRCYSVSRLVCRSGCAVAGGAPGCRHRAMCCVVAPTGASGCDHVGSAVKLKGRGIGKLARRLYSTCIAFRSCLAVCLRIAMWGTMGTGLSRATHAPPSTMTHGSRIAPRATAARCVYGSGTCGRQEQDAAHAPHMTRPLVSYLYCTARHRGFTKFPLFLILFSILFAHCCYRVECR